MPDSDKPAKPTPSIEEINAYLEESAARTKKRLPLMGTGGAKPAPRTLPVVVNVPTPSPASAPAPDAEESKAKK